MLKARRRICTRVKLCVAAMALATAPGVALASTQGPAAGKASATTVGAAQAKVGQMLVDSRGHALYLFTGTGCSRSCARAWSPLLANGATQAAKGSGVNASLLGKTRLGNGKFQVTYAHHALYLFANDRRAGQLGGEGAHQFGGFWYVVDTHGNAIKPKKKTGGGGGGVCNPLCPGY